MFKDHPASISSPVRETIGLLSPSNGFRCGANGTRTQRTRSDTFVEQSDFAVVAPSVVRQFISVMTG